MLLAQPRGFCAGVEMAIKALAWMVQVFEPQLSDLQRHVLDLLGVPERAYPGPGSGP